MHMRISLQFVGNTMDIRNIVKPYLFVAELIILIIFLSGCSGLQRQASATTEGLKINYYVKKERLNMNLSPTLIKVVDDRLNRDVIRDGAKTNVGDRFLGFFAFGILSFAMPNEPEFQGKSDMVGMFNRAFSQRLYDNGIKKVSNARERHYTLEIEIRNFALDFSFGTWIAEVGYVAKLYDGTAVIKKQNVNEVVKKFNLYGYGSGEEALSDAFNVAINKLEY